MVVRRIGALSLGKVMAAVYGGMGLIFGALFAMLSLVGAGIGGAAGSEDPVFGLLFGVGAVIALPLMYGIFGFIGGLLTAAIYNLAAGIVGGLELQVE